MTTVWNVACDADEDDALAPPADLVDVTAAAPGDSASEPPAWDGQSTRPLLLPDGSFNLERGFTDAKSAVRLWTDESGDITKVRVAPTWRDRLARGAAPVALARGLSTAFGQAFAVINIAHRELPTATAWVDDVPPAAELLSWEALAVLRERMDEVTRALANIPLEQRQPPPSPPGAMGVAANGAVQVHLNGEGGYSTVRFAPAWLEDSRVRQVCDAVAEAARQARARHQPSQPATTQYHELLAHSRQLRNELSALMKRGFF